MGSGHQDEARRLRSKLYTSITGEQRKDGWDIEKIMGERGLDVYVAGHEHVMQTHRGPSEHNAIDHVVCGASIYSHFYGTVVADEKLDWFNRGVVGFVAFTATRDALRIQVVDSRSQQVVHEVTRIKDATKTAAQSTPTLPSGARGGKWRKK